MSEEEREQLKISFQLERIAKHQQEHRALLEEYCKKLDNHINMTDGRFNFINAIIENNPSIGKKGLVEIVNELQNKLEGMLLREKINIAKKALLVTVGGMLLAIIDWVYNNLLNHK